MAKVLLDVTLGDWESKLSFGSDWRGVQAVRVNVNETHGRRDP
jgi:hypothetical protein